MPSRRHGRKPARASAAFFYGRGLAASVRVARPACDERVCLGACVVVTAVVRCDDASFACSCEQPAATIGNRISAAARRMAQLY
jgi:hypothetical protein